MEYAELCMGMRLDIAPLHVSVPLHHPGVRPRGFEVSVKMVGQTGLAGGHGMLLMMRARCGGSGRFGRWRRSGAHLRRGPAVEFHQVAFGFLCDHCPRSTTQTAAVTGAKADRSACSGPPVYLCWANFRSNGCGRA